MSERIERFALNPFLDGPTQTLVKQVALAISEVKQFKKIFGDSFDTYQRFDYSIRELPALRVYNERFTKVHESHYIEGELKLDVVFPANLRRDETQHLQDVISAALLQQLRRRGFFSALQVVIPGLNELGKVFSSDKTLGMVWQDDVLPLTQLVANFRIDLKQWDEYLEREGRSVEDPFEVTLADLDKLEFDIRALRTDAIESEEIKIGAEVPIKQED